MSRLIKLLVLSVFLTTTLLTGIPLQKAAAVNASDWDAGRIIDDNVFYTAGGLSIDDIQNFLNSKVPTCDTNGSQIYSGSTTRAQRGTSMGYPPPYTCLKNYSQSVGGEAPDAYCGAIGAGTFSAATIIHEVARACGVNSAALVVLLEKEQSLVTDTWPWSNEYRSATGYGCPDTAACDAKYYGFFNQVYNAAWQFKYYAANPSQFRYKPFQNNTIQYNPNGACGSSTVYIENRATAALYNYTPYQPNASALNNLYGSGDGCGAYGNRNFWRLYNDWFGASQSPVGFCNSSLNVAGAGSGMDVLKFNYQNNNNLAFAITNNTGTGCVEVHPWNGGEQSWASHIVTCLPAFDPTQGKLVVVPGAPNDKLLYVKYNGAGGHIEVHEFSSDFQHWSGHYITNQASSELADGTVMAVGGKLVFVKYHGAGGHIEVHEWAPGYQSWSGHYVTNQLSSQLDNGSGTLVTRYDHLDYVKYHGSGDRVEVHEWAPGSGYQSWSGHYVTNQSASELTNGKIVSRGEYLDFIKYKGVPNIEVHEWAPGYQTWLGHYASNQAVTEDLHTQL